MGSATVALSMLGTLVPLFAVDRAVGATALGVLVALPNVFPVVLAVAAGRWVDRGGPTRWLVVGTAGVTVGPLLLVAAPGVAAMAASQLLVGVAQLFATLAAQSIVADVANGRSRTRNFSWFTTTLSAGRLVGPVLAGVVVDAAGFRAAFGVVAAATLVPVAIAVALHRARQAAARAAPAARPRRSGILGGRGRTRPRRWPPPIAAPARRSRTSASSSPCSPAPASSWRSASGPRSCRCC